MNSRNLINGLILIAIGILFLLVNLGYISFAVLFSIFDLWPLILIVVGINILFKKKPIISFITWTLFFIILIFYGAFYEGRNIVGISTGHNANFIKPVETLYGELSLDIGAAKVNIGSDEKNLLSFSSQGAELDYRDMYRNNKEIAVFNFENKHHNVVNFNNKGSRYDFNLNKDVIWDLDIDLGAISGKLNLEDIPVRSVNVDAGAGNLDIILGSKHNKSNIEIDSGASNLTIVIPKNAGIKLKLGSPLNKTNVNDLNLTKSGDYYISSNYDEASTKLEFDIDIGVGKIDFKIKE